MGKSARDRAENEKRGKKKSLVLWGIVALGIIGVIFIIYKAASLPPAPQGGVSDIPATAITDSDWKAGNKDAKVNVIEYGDFECPACAAYAPIFKQLVVDYGDRVLFVFRNYPLPQHPSAKPAAYAAGAAGLQGKFWEIHDMLFENQKEWSSYSNAKEIFIKYAQSLNLDVERFKNDLDSKEVKGKGDNDYQKGVGLGVNATPTFFLNGDKLDNPRSYEEFKNIVQKAVSQNQ